MSFTKERREQIKKYILEKIDDREGDIAKRTSGAFGISLNTAYRYLREMEESKQSLCICRLQEMPSIQ